MHSTALTLCFLTLCQSNPIQINGNRSRGRYGEQSGYSGVKPTPTICFRVIWATLLQDLSWLDLLLSGRSLNTQCTWRHLVSGVPSGGWLSCCCNRGWWSRSYQLGIWPEPFLRIILLPLWLDSIVSPVLLQWYCTGSIPIGGLHWDIKWLVQAEQMPSCCESAKPLCGLVTVPGKGNVWWLSAPAARITAFGYVLFLLEMSPGWNKRALPYTQVLRHFTVLASLAAGVKSLNKQLLHVYRSMF